MRYRHVTAPYKVIPVHLRCASYSMESRISRACCPLNGPRPPAGSRRKNASGWIQESWWSRNELRPRKPRLPSASQRGCRDEVQPFSRTHLQVSSGNKLLQKNKGFLAVMRKNRNLGSDAQSWQCRTSKVLGGGRVTGGGVGGLTDVRPAPSSLASCHVPTTMRG